MIKRKKEKSKFFILIVVLLVISLALFLISILYNPNKVLETEEIYSTILVGEPAGFDLNGTALTFGRLPPTTSAKREIILTNNYEFPIVAEFSVEGNVSDFIIYNAPVSLDIGENQTIEINTVKIPENATYGLYDGYFIIEFYKA